MNKSANRSAAPKPSKAQSSERTTGNSALQELFLDELADVYNAEKQLVVSGPKYRFYAGAPLITPDNRALGTLCVIDTARRTLSAAQKTDLITLSQMVMTRLELRRRLKKENGKI